ncbi:hypothetical protein ACTI_68200 [Actinoplanes sp. OR16]|nr:hypothetical protein ACTI_68200 [Actinoplanes sp. OR16]
MLRRLGQGGMGTVFLAEAPGPRHVAVKVIRPEYAHEEHYRARFRSEVSRARQVPPFCTAEVLDADPDHETPYLVVEYVDGPSLDEVVRENGPLTGGSLHGVAVGVATALAAIHGAGVIHRDLKPRNVLFALGTPKVIDFGIARPLEPTSFHTRAEEVVGTLAYMAPERLDPATDRLLTPAADVFAWGAVVTFAGTGRTPFGGDSPGVTAARILTQPPRIGDLPPYLAQLVVAALDKEPANRPTAPELLDRLLVPGTPSALPVELRREAVAARRSGHRDGDAAAGRGGERDAPPDGAREARRGGRRHGSSGRTRRMAAAAVAVALAGAGAGIALRNRDEAPRAAQTTAVTGPAVFDSLRQPGGLFSESASCVYRNGLRVAAGGRCGSYLHTVFPAAQAVQVTATLAGDRSCAAIWFRATDQNEEDAFADAYRVSVCPDEVSLAGSIGGADDPIASVRRATSPGAAHLIQLVADERQATITIDGSPALQGLLTASTLISGRVLLGTAGRGPVTFTDLRLRSGTDVTSPAVPGFVTGDAQFTAGVHLMSDQDRVAVVEPATYPSGADYCREHGLDSTAAQCAKEHVPVLSGTQVTLPVVADPVYRDYRGDPAKCRDPRTLAGTCEVPFREFTILSGEPSPWPALVTVRGGKVAEIAKMGLS